MNESTKSSVNNGSTNPFTPEEDAFIIANINLMSFEELTIELNKRFNRGRTKSSVYQRDYNYLHAKKKGRVPIGSEHFDGVHWWVKVRAGFTRTSKHSYRDCWEYKHKVVWEREHGKKLPEDCVIVFLDGDGSNCAPNNLYAIPKKINAMMCRNRWHFENAEAKKAAIKWCELYYVLKGVQE